MSTPARFKAAFVAALTDALPDLIDAAWKKLEDKAPLAPKPRVREANAKRRRLEKNRMQLAVKNLIAGNDDEGLTLSDIRRALPHEPGIDGTISESTLKRALMVLRSREEIETRNSKWHLAPPAYAKERR